MTITDKQAMREKFEAWAGERMSIEPGPYYYACDFTEKAWEGYRAALEAAEAAREVGDFVLVPRELTEEMLDASEGAAWATKDQLGPNADFDSFMHQFVQAQWRAALKAAPQPAAPSSAEQPAPGAPEADERSAAVIGAPDRIWLNVGELLLDTEFSELQRTGDVSWCDDKIDAADVGYVRADAARAQSSAAPVSERALTDLIEALKSCERALERRTEERNKFAAELTTARTNTGAALAVALNLRMQTLHNAVYEYGVPDDHPLHQMVHDAISATQSASSDYSAVVDEATRAHIDDLNSQVSVLRERLIAPADARDAGQKIQDEYDARRYRWPRVATLADEQHIHREARGLRVLLCETELGAAIDRAMGGE